MTTTSISSNRGRRRSSNSVRSAAAGVAVKAAQKQGKVPDPQLVKLAATQSITARGSADTAP